MTVTSIPTVDVILTFHRIDNFLEDSVRSALNSRLVDTRIIAVDDREDSSPLPDYFHHQKITIVRSDRRGYAAALNKGFEFVTSDFLAFLNSDDLQDNLRLYSQILSLEKSNGLICITAIRKFTGSKRIRQRMGSIKSKFFIPQLHLFGFFYANSTWLIDRRNLNLALHWREDVDHTFSDWLLFSESFLNSPERVVYLNKKLYFQRVHSNQISKNVKITSIPDSVTSRWMNIYLKYSKSSKSVEDWRQFFVPYFVDTLRKPKSSKVFIDGFTLYKSLSKSPALEMSLVSRMYFNYDLARLIFIRCVYAFMKDQAGFQKVGKKYGNS
jgi:glycosyltransferase involved in cell wall biosynthesis